MHPPRARLTALVIALLAAGGLTACGAATPDGVDIDVDKGKIAFSGTDGEVKVDFGDGASVPGDFPSAIPLPDLKPALAGTTTIDGLQGWNLTYQDVPREQFENYVATLKGADGAESTFSMDQNGIRNETLTVGGYDVNVSYDEGIGMTLFVAERS